MTGIEMIARERHEQLTIHGKTIESDVTGNTNAEIIGAVKAIIHGDVDYWPHDWSMVYWKKIQAKSRQEKLMVAGALLAAEIDRLQNR